MTGYPLSETLARIILWVSVSAMGIGVILILLALFTTKKKCDEHLTVTNEMMRIYQGSLHELDNVTVNVIKQERLAKKQIPDKLKEIDDYLASTVEHQNLCAENLFSLAKKIYRWYDFFNLLFIFIAYSNRLFKRLFKDAQVNYVIKFATRFNVALRESGLGTLPTIETDKQYLQMYRDLIQLESGLPFKIAFKIHRNILLSISINSLRILRADCSFWDELEAKKIKPIMVKTLELIRNSLSWMMLPVDTAILALRNEISNEIDNYIGETK